MPALQKIKMYYDPLGRLVKTINPDNSEQRIVYGIPDNLNTPNKTIPTPWENYTYDANDLAPLTNPTGSNVPSTHYYTPKSSEVDALGRTITTKDYFDNSNYNNVIEMNYHYDIRGNLLLVKDPYNRNVFEHVYDLRTPQKGEDGKQQPLPPLWTKHIDKGESTVLFDALAKPIESHDAKDARGLNSYDTLQRPVNAWANNKTGDSTTLRNHLIYGDSAGLTNPENQNLKGQLYKNYDEAGLIEIPEYDFKSNVLTKNRQVISSVTLKAELDNYNNFLIDWTGLPNILDSFVFETSSEYDALNRITKLTLPENVNAQRKEIIPTYNNAGALEKVSYDGTTYVENIAYNAKGQRLLIAFGNDIMTRYTYNPFTFRLQRQRSEKYVKSQTGNTITYTYQSGTNKQDDKFNYDLIGNIVNLFTRVTDCGIGGTPDELDRTFEYDPIYRLTYADGRESDTQSGNNYLYDDAPIPSTPLPSNVNYYEREYSYDKLGNVQQVKQLGTNGFTRNFVYNNGKNTLQKVEDATPTLIENFTYDNCGNQITAGSTRNYQWNYADQLLCYKNQAGSADPTVFTQYDYAGQDRVSKLVRTGTSANPVYERTIYIGGIFEYIKLETTSNTYEKNYVHIMDDKSRIAEVRVGDVFPNDITDDVTYILEDQIGSSVARLSTSGTIIDKEEYYPFGDSSLRTFTYKRYRYVGKEKDQESGLYYYGARYYAAWTCRFISVDPLAADYPFYTPYNYAGNKPINMIDMDGLQESVPTGSVPTGGGQGSGGNSSGSGKTGGGGDLRAVGTPGAGNNIQSGGGSQGGTNTTSGTGKGSAQEANTNGTRTAKTGGNASGSGGNNGQSSSGGKGKSMPIGDPDINTSFKILPPKGDSSGKANSKSNPDNLKPKTPPQAAAPTPNETPKQNSITGSPPPTAPATPPPLAAPTQGASRPSTESSGSGTLNPFHGITIHIDKNREVGYTIPPIGIFIGSNSLTWKMHEYGHFLQYKRLGFLRYYLEVAIPSAINQGTGIGGDHDYFYTEVDANREAVIHFSKYFGKDTINRFIKNHPIIDDRKK